MRNENFLPVNPIDGLPPGITVWFRNGAMLVVVEDGFLPTSTREWDQIKAYILMSQGWLCNYCERELNWKTATIDHMIPRKHDGSDHYVNLAVCCGSCNSRKGARSPMQWQDPEEYARMMASDWGGHG